MAWDSSRPVAYRRLFKEWLVYAVIMAAIFLLVTRGETNEVSLLGGLLASLPLYVGFSYVLAKFGYQRKTFAELRTPRATTSVEPATAERPRPAPTRRTAGSSHRPGNRPTGRRRR